MSVWEWKSVVIATGTDEQITELESEVGSESEQVDWMQKLCLSE